MQRGIGCLPGANDVNGVICKLVSTFFGDQQDGRGAIRDGGAVEQSQWPGNGRVACLVVQKIPDA